MWTWEGCHKWILMKCRIISALTSLKRRQVKGRSLHDLISAKTLKRKTCLNNKNDQENLLPANQKDESVQLVFVFRQIDHWEAQGLAKWAINFKEYKLSSQNLNWFKIEQKRIHSLVLMIYQGKQIKQY